MKTFSFSRNNFFAKLRNNSSTNVKLTFLTSFLMFLQNLLFTTFYCSFNQMSCYPIPLTLHRTKHSATHFHVQKLYLSTTKHSSSFRNLRVFNSFTGKTMLPHISKGMVILSGFSSSHHSIDQWIEGILLATIICLWITVTIVAIKWHIHYTIYLLLRLCV